MLWEKTIPSLFQNNENISTCIFKYTILNFLCCILVPNTHIRGHLIGKKWRGFCRLTFLRRSTDFTNFTKYEISRIDTVNSLYLELTRDQIVRHYGERSEVILAKIQYRDFFFSKNNSRKNYVLHDRPFGLATWPHDGSCIQTT